MSELHEVTANIRPHRLRRYVDEEIERWEDNKSDFIGSGAERYPDGRIDALRMLRALYLLTPEESTAAEALRREMFG